MRGWLSWSIAAVFVLYLFLLQASTSVMIPELAHAFTIDAAGVGLLSASYFYGYIILQMPAGSLVDRLGARLVLTVSTLGCALACGLFACAHRVGIAELSRILMGIMTSAGVVAALYLAANWFSAQRFALLVGLTEMLGMLGGAVGQNALAYAVKHLGWRATIIVCGLIGLTLAILTICCVRNGPDSIRRTSQTRKRMLNEFWQVLKIPRAWMNGFFGGLVFAVITGFAALWSVPYLMKLYNIPLTKAAAASSMVFWGAALGGPVIGWVSDYFGKRRLIMQLGTSLVLLLSVILFYGPQISLSCMFVGLFVLGFFCGVYVLMFAVVCHIVPATFRGAAMGFTNMLCILFGAPILQPLIGYLLKFQQTNFSHTAISNFSIHNYQVAFIVLPVSVFLALISIFFIYEKNVVYEKCIP